MKKKIYIISLVFFFNIANADMDTVLNRMSSKISETAASFIPGEGITEVNIEIQQTDSPDFSILGVRNIEKTSKTNLFSQFGLRSDDVAGSERLVGNLGLGYRTLNYDETLMFGINSFLDLDTISNKRASVGLEAKAANLEFILNKYYGLSHQEKIDGTKVQALSSIDYSLSTQLPYMPWSRFKWKSYKHEADIGAKDIEGDKYSLHANLSPTLSLNFFSDESNRADGDTLGANLLFSHPPREGIATMKDGMSSEMFEKENMSKKLESKIERDNSLTVEIQGSVIITSK